MEIEHFYPKYPNIFNVENPLLNPYEQDFNDVIVKKREFEELRLKRSEPAPGTPGLYYNHQKIISRFMDAMTPYSEILIFHDMGTGKTCTAIAVIEQLRQSNERPNGTELANIKGAIILAKGSGLLKNFAQELLFTCTDGRYIPEDYDKLTDMERVRRTRRIVGKFYTFYTFEIFAKMVSKLSNADIIKRFSNHVFVVDEVHHMRQKREERADPNNSVKQFFKRVDPLEVYKQFHRVFHLVIGCRIMLMSGTVMADDPSEIASVMNLILPLSMQMPVEREFTDAFFNEDATVKPSAIPEMSRYFKGRVSYLKSSYSEVQKVFIGVKNYAGLRYFIINPLEMSSFQAKWYVKALAKDRNERNIFSNARQAALFVFPDGTYGSDGFTQTRYIVKRNRNKQPNTTQFSLGTDLLAEFDQMDTSSKLAKLAKFSCKFADTIRHLLTRKGNSFVYCEYVNGSGAILFSKVLELFGFSAATGEEKTPGNRYALLTIATATQVKISRLINRFNQGDNASGDFISVIIGSKIVSEGFTFKNIVQEFILTPFWNYSETSQVIARGWRIGSHNALLKQGRPVQVDIFQQVAVLPNGPDTDSIDLVMYQTSERKDVAMRQIEHVIKLSSFDCPLNYERNYIVGYDNQRECDYKDCAYQCLSPTQDTPLDQITYDLYYNRQTKVKSVLSNYFRKNTVVSFQELVRLFPGLDYFEIVASIKALVDSNYQFVDRFGFPSFVRTQNDKVFITTDYKTPNNDVLSEYYSEKLIIQNGDSFDLILKEMYYQEIPSLIRQMFTNEFLMKRIIVTLPSIIQRLILEACIEANLQDLNSHVKVRQQVLDFFKGFYQEINSEWYIWIYRNELGVERRIGPNVWQPLVEEESQRVLAFRKTPLLASPIGFYGMYNPRLDEFCIRDVRQLNIANKRKLTIGRRCSDYSTPQLVDLAARRMQLPVPSSNKTLKEIAPSELAAKVKQIKYSTPQDLTDVNAMQRFLYWSAQIRSNTCQEIRNWFERNNLIEESFECGTHNKKIANV